MSCDSCEIQPDGSTVVTPPSTATGDVVGPNGTTDGRICKFDGTTGKLIAQTGNTDVELAAAVDHVTDVNNPHQTSIDNILGGTFANLDTAVTDAKLIQAPLIEPLGVDPIAVYTDGQQLSSSSFTDSDMGNWDTHVTGDGTDHSGLAPLAHTHVEADIIDLQTYALRDGDAMTNASVNGVTLSNVAFVGYYLNGVGNYVQPQAGEVVNTSGVTGLYVQQALDNLDAAIVAPAYGELRRNSQGNQSLSTTKVKLDFNQDGGSSNTTVSSANDRITVTNAGTYRIALTGAATIKRDYMYYIHYRINGDSGTDGLLWCQENGEDNVCITLAGSIILTLAASDDIELWGSCSGTKDFKMEEGAGFSIVAV